MSMNNQLSIFLRHLSLDPANTHYMMTPAELIEQTVLKKQGVLADTGALCIDTGKFTGRSPKDRFIVRDAIGCILAQWLTPSVSTAQRRRLRGRDTS